MPNPTLQPSRGRLLAISLLLALGIILWLLQHRPITFRTAAGVLLVTALASIPTVRQLLERLLLLFRAPSPRSRQATTLAIFFLAAGYLFALTVLEHQTHYPRFHDESMHLLQARMLASGKLWMPPHPLPQFFETFFVLTAPVYAAMQFPGASLFYVPGMWLNIPPWVTSLLIAAATCALLYRVIAELIDGAFALVAVVWLLAIEDFRYHALMVLSYPVALLLGLAIIWTYLRWRDRKSLLRCLPLGLLVGWAAINRPGDAACFALLVLAAMLFDLRDATRATRRSITTFAVILAAAAPFLVLQLAFDKGVTGSFLHTPHRLYVTQFNPALDYGLDPDSSAPPLHTALQEKLDYYNGYVLPQSRDYTPRTAVQQWLTHRLPLIFFADLPTTLILIVLPCGLIALSTRPRRLVAAVLVIFVAVYAFIPIFPSTYSLITILPLVCLALLGVDSIIVTLESTGLPARTPIMTLALALGVSQLPNLAAPVQEQYMTASLAALHDHAPKISGRVVIFCRYRTGDNFQEDPVYNLESSQIDDCRIVLAQDLGPIENKKLFDYYRRLQTDRTFYRFDRSTGEVYRIDPVAENAAAKSGA